MRKKLTTIAEAKMFPVNITGSNREMLRYYENLMMAEVGTDNPCDIQNTAIVNRAITEGYKARNKK